MPENIINNLAETLAENIQKQVASEGKSEYVSSQVKRLFGREKPIHNLFGGGKSADVLLWRNKKISASYLASATVIWVLFEWLNYNFLSIVCFVLLLGMLGQFIWSNASGMLKGSPSEVPRFSLPDDFLANIAVGAGHQINRGLQFIQDVAIQGNVKQFLVVVASLFIAAIIGSWCNFLTVFYIGFVAAHTLPVLYEKYEDQVDDFAYQVLGQLQNNFRKFDSGILSKIPQGKAKDKKHD